MSRSSIASPGGANHLRGGLQACPGRWCSRLSFSTQPTRQHDVGRRGQRRHEHALDDQQRRACRLAGGGDPRDVAERAGRARIEDVERRHLCRPRRRRGGRRRSGSPLSPAPTGSPRARAPLTLGASTSGTTNFVSAGCGLALDVQLTAMRGVAEAAARRADESSSCEACAESRNAEPSPARPTRARRAPSTRCPRWSAAGRPAPAHHRLRQALLALDPVVVEAADVAHPVAVDRRA